MPFENLLSPVKIGRVTIRNRIVFPPIDAALHTKGAAVDPRYIEFLSTLAKDSGVGLIISEFTAVANDQFWAPASRFDKDEFKPSFKKMVEAIHAHEAKTFMQLALLGGRDPVGRAIAPSAIKSPLYPGIPEELTRREIHQLVSKWAQAAIRARDVGFDGVEVHGGHTYLVGAFMSPHANRREDEYGGDFNGRMRFPTEIVQAIKKACGEDYPVGIKFSAFEALDNGINGPLSVDIAMRMENVGVDCLHVSSSTYMLAGTEHPDVPPMYVREGPLVGLAEKIKKNTSVPVITVAGIYTPEFAEKIVAQGSADMVAVGRAMFADPHWASKLSSGRPLDINRCIRCNVCHKKIVIDRAGAAECTVNPGLLKKLPPPVAQPKKVTVVGAGPAGLEAALQASQRGHEVVLYEKSDSIGGNIRIGCIPPFKKDLLQLLERYERRLNESTVHYVPNHEVSPASLASEKSDTVVIATGGEEYIPEIPGIDGAVTAIDFYRDSALQKKAKGNAVVIGAGDVGCEIAWYLSLLGRKVHLVDMLAYSEWLADEHPTNRMILLEKLEEAGVMLIDNAKVTDIGKSGAYIILQSENVEYKIGTDILLLATGYRKKEDLAKGLRELISGRNKPEILEIGACADARDIHWAIREGYETGTSI
jgi:2,4-dienoyl-CoA reductase-like NADH-dependent reductase (Old Yellow Enzyme family)/thioredoxin reductase